MAESFADYYRRFFRVLGRELWTTWRTEAWPSVLLALATYFLTRGDDHNAWHTFVYAGVAAGLYWVAWGIYHLIRTPWKLSCEAQPIPVATVQQRVLQTSQTVMEFIFAREQSAPQLTTHVPRFPGLGNDAEYIEAMERSGREFAARSAYEDSTLEIYDSRYRRDVLEAVALVKSQGIDCGELEEYVTGLQRESEPTYAGISIPPSDYIKRIGKQLGDAADKLPKDENVSQKLLTRGE